MFVLRRDLPAVDIFKVLFCRWTFDFHATNRPSYQGIDQSKVVPLLTAALQEAISKIEQLETRIQTLENN